MLIIIELIELIELANNYDVRNGALWIKNNVRNGRLGKSDYNFYILHIFHNPIQNTKK